MSNETRDEQYVSLWETLVRGLGEAEKAARELAKIDGPNDGRSFFSGDAEWFHWKTSKLLGDARESLKVARANPRWLDEDAA